MNRRRVIEEKLMNEKIMKNNINNKHYIVNYTHFSMLNWLKMLKYSDKFKYM